MVETIDLIGNPPSAEEFVAWMKQSELPIKRFFNTSGLKYREYGLKDQMDHLSLEEAAELLAKDGMLVKRPMLIKDDRFLINGFNAEKYEEVLQG